MASRTILRSKSHDRWTPSRIEYGQSTHRLDQEARDPGRQHHTTVSPTSSLDLPEGYAAATTSVTSATVA